MVVDNYFVTTVLANRGNRCNVDNILHKRQRILWFISQTVLFQIHPWAFSYLIASTSKYFLRKVAWCPWNHTMCQIRGTHTMTDAPSCAVSHAALMRQRRFDVLSLFIINFFMEIPAHRQGVCMSGQAMILSVGTLVCGV